METVKLESIGKEVTLLPLTHGMQKKSQAVFMKGVYLERDTEGRTRLGNIPAINSQLTEDLLVQLRFGLSDEEMDKISDTEFDRLKEVIAEDNAKKKQEPTT